MKQTAAELATMNADMAAALIADAGALSMLPGMELLDTKGTH